MSAIDQPTEGPEEAPRRSTGGPLLRETRPEDLPHFFRFQLNPRARWMAAFTAPDPSDWERFQAGWGRILADETITKRTLLHEGEVAGNVLLFTAHWSGKREVGYTVDPQLWGRGLATAALRALLAEVEERPLQARAAADNAASIRVLEKCGFVRIGTARGYANARGAEIDEAIFELR